MPIRSRNKKKKKEENKIRKLKPTEGWIERLSIKLKQKKKTKKKEMIQKEKNQWRTRIDRTSSIRCGKFFFNFSLYVTQSVNNLYRFTAVMPIARTMNAIIIVCGFVLFVILQNYQIKALHGYEPETDILGKLRETHHTWMLNVFLFILLCSGPIYN